MVLPSTQLVVLRFGPGARFEGGLTGALERIETGGALRILDALFVRRAPETGELEVLSSESDGAGRVVAAALDFRLDEGRRRQRTEAALAREPGIEALGEALEPGAALAALLIEHRWAEALQDAAARMGGEPAAVEFVDASALSEITGDLLGLAQR